MRMPAKLIEAVAYGPVITTVAPSTTRLRADCIDVDGRILAGEWAVHLPQTGVLARFGQCVLGRVTGAAAPFAGISILQEVFGFVRQ